MSRETFETNMLKRLEAIHHFSDHSIFNELKGRIIEYDYDTKSLTMQFEATDFHRNGFGIMFGGSLVGMFDIAFGTLTAGLGNFDIAPTVQLSTSFLKGIPIGTTVQVKVKAVSAGKSIMNFTGEAYADGVLSGSASGIFMTPKPFKKYIEDEE